MAAIERMERTSAAKDTQIARLASALIASEKRHEALFESVAGMHKQLGELTSAVNKLSSGAYVAPPRPLPPKPAVSASALLGAGKAANGAPSDDEPKNPIEGMLKGISGLGQLFNNNPKPI